MTDSITLRPLTRIHLIYTFMQEDVFKEWLEYARLPRTQHEWNDLIQKMKSEGDILFQITQGNSVVGFCGLHHISYINRNCELRIAVWTPGKGIGSIAVKQLLDYAFDELGMNKVWLGVLVTNERAKRCYERAGFRTYGVSKEHVFLHGKWHDVAYMDVMKGDKDEGDG